MRFFYIVALVALLGVGCNEPMGPRAFEDSNVQRDGTEMEPDNTALNQRDRDGTTLTPTDQSEDQADLDITANIRKRVVDSQLSTNAENVKIITQDGKVTLRGPVESVQEKQRIEEIATAVAGASNVDSQLEVADTDLDSDLNTDPNTDLNTDLNQ